MLFLTLINTYENRMNLISPPLMVENDKPL